MQLIRVAKKVRLVKKKFARFFKTANSQSLSPGFTLIELLVAMSISMILISVSGFGLVAIMKGNSKADTRIQRRAELNRALDFIADEVRMASIVSDTTPAPTWGGWTLTGSSPSPQLYMQIPLKVVSMTASTDTITVINHGFSAGNAVMFTGTGTVAGNLSKNVVYYITKSATTPPPADTFKVSTSLTNAESQTSIDLSSDSFGSSTANRLLIYYISDSGSTWLPPKRISRSAGPCLTPYTNNCETLVDSIAETGFTADVTSLRQAELKLLGKPFSNSLETYPVSTKVFARSSVSP